MATGFFLGTRQTDSKFHMEKQTCKNSQVNSEKEERWGQQGLPNIKILYSYNNCLAMAH